MNTVSVPTLPREAGRDPVRKKLKKQRHRARGWGKEGKEGKKLKRKVEATTSRWDRKHKHTHTHRGMAASVLLHTSTFSCHILCFLSLEFLVFSHILKTRPLTNQYTLRRLIFHSDCFGEHWLQFFFSQRDYTNL